MQNDRDHIAISALEQLQQAVLVVDWEYRIVYANRSLRDGLSLSPERIISSACHVVTHGSTAPCWHRKDTECPVRTALETGRRATAIHKHLHESRLHVEEIVATPLAGTDLVIEEFRDISHLLGLADGILAICSSCKRVRDEAGAWQQREGYVSQRTGVDFSHGLCPDCLRRLYPEYGGGE